MSEAATPDDGALTLDQAVEVLAPAAGDEGDVPPDDPEAGSGPDDDAAAGEPGDAGPLEAPLYWSRDAKARFAELPPELQAVVLSQEGPREEAAARAKAAAAAEVGQVSHLAELLGERLPGWLAAFEDRWGASPPDWVAIAREHGAEAMSVAKAQYEAERQQLADATAAKAEADVRSHEAYLRTEFGRLAEIAPHLADPEHGPAERAEVARYLIASGVEPEGLEQISAAELTVAHKALLWDRAQAALRAGARFKPPSPSRSPVRPAAGSAQNSQSRTAHGAQARFQSKPTIANAVELLLSRQGTR